MAQNERLFSDEFNDTMVVDQPQSTRIKNPLDKVVEKRRESSKSKAATPIIAAHDDELSKYDQEFFNGASPSVLTLEQKIGRLLSQTRQQKGSTLEEVSEALKIRSRYLQAMEEGRIADIPADVYVKGYLKSYSKHLGINNNPLFENFKLGKHNVPTEDWQTPVSQPGNHFKAKWWVILISVALALIIYGFWHKSRADQSLQVKPSIVSNSRMSSLGAFIKGPTDKGSKIVVLATSSTILKITPADQAYPSIHQLKEGDALFVPGNKDGIFISANNPGSVEVFLDGKTYRFLGTLEEIRSDKPIVVR
ncbi:MAG: helix-turn-helix domain-containing protein [Alphaproteobacteria bacterium]|nr:helix-turn-helix domain-containing protein [Alphaproteobacteria bacterium]